MKVEHNNRKQADKFAEYITGQGLRQYLAKKVRHYVGDNPSVFDGAVGSGQLEQQLRQSVKSTLTRQLRQSKFIACLEPSLMASFNGFCDELISLIHHEKLDNSLLGANCVK